MDSALGIRETLKTCYFSSRKIYNPFKSFCPIKYVLYTAQTWILEKSPLESIKSLLPKAHSSGASGDWVERKCRFARGMKFLFLEK
jgi:hypothetical protein